MSHTRARPKLPNHLGSECLASREIPGGAFAPLTFSVRLPEYPLMSDYDQRFGGLSRLLGVPGLERLRRAHVAVVGIGGVGSWAVEALARSGVGELTLVDLDDVCITNVNRQLHALDGEIGQPKVAAMVRRIIAINPECVVHSVPDFFTAATADIILAPRFDYLLDAIDGSTLKCLLISQCRSRGIPILTVGAAGGRRDPSLVRVADLAHASHDRLLRETRVKLRAQHGFPRGEIPFGVTSVFSNELPVYPARDGSVCAQREPDTEVTMDCNSGYGTASFVTGTFGLIAAGCVVRQLAAGVSSPPDPAK